MKIKYEIIIAALIMVGCIYFIDKIIFYEDNTGVVVGQIWVENIDDNKNPFYDITPDEHYVLEIRGDWVKHVNIKYLDYEQKWVDMLAWTDKIYWFKQYRYLKLEKKK